MARARKSRTSNYTNLSNKEKPLPFNAVRYIALQLKQMHDGIDENEFESFDNELDIGATINK